MSHKKHEDDFFIGINITPFTDIVLVLLIIFMVAAPQIPKSGMQVDLPRASAKSENPVNGDGIREVTVIDSKMVIIDESTVEVAAIPELIKKMGRGTDEVFAVSAGSKSLYQDVVTVLDSIRRAGAGKVFLRTVAE